MEYIDDVHIRFALKIIQTCNKNYVIKATKFNLGMVQDTLEHRTIFI